jgi:hypothetical protein
MPVYARRASVILLASAVILVIAVVATWSSLPGSVAMVWTVAGHPRGHVSRPVAVAVLLAVPLAFAVLTASFARLNLVTLMRLGFTAVGLLVTVATALRAVFTLAVNAEYGGAAIPVAVAVLAAIVMVLIALRASLYIVRAPADEADGPPQWRGTDGDRPLWRSAVAARRPIISCIVFFVIGIGAAYIATDVGGVILGVGGIVGGVFILSLTAIVVEIDQREFRIRYFGGTRWPATHIPISTIREVEVVNVDPPRSGGWGYRGSLRMQGAAAVNIRRGPGIRLKLDGGKRFLVTVDDAEGAAQALQPFVTTP